MPASHFHGAKIDACIFCLPVWRFCVADTILQGTRDLLYLVIATHRHHSGDFMLRSDTLFGKRDANSPNPPLGSSHASSSLNSSGANSFNKPSSLSSGGLNNAQQQSASTTNEVGSKLIVGPNIKLKGVEITDCDTLVVEGFV